MNDHEVSTEDGRLRFVVSDPLEEYRVKTLSTKEPETIAWIDRWRDLVPHGVLRFWDVGANIGIYTMYAAANTANSLGVSIEPYFPNFVRLRSNILLNSLDNVTPLWLALSDQSGVATFAVKDERIGASGNVLVSEPAKADETTFKKHERILQARGDDLAEMLGVPHFLKIDVDGLELSIIRGMSSLLATPALRSVLVEANSEADRTAMTSVFAAAGLHPDDSINLLENHSSKRRRKDPTNSAENWVFTRS